MFLKAVVKAFILMALLLGLPPLGLWLAGVPVAPYLEFPPRTRFVPHAGFSWAVWVSYAGAIVLLAGPLARQAVASRRGRMRPAGGRGAWPWWGWAGLALTALAWSVAWNPWAPAARLRVYAFVPLWCGFILTVNALALRRNGSCLLTRRPWRYAALFPVSAFFWWFFEYLNRFVQNWHYTGVHFGPPGYALHASLCFSTVLPAVLGTREWIAGMGWLQRGFRHFWPTLFWGRPGCALGLGVVAGIGLAGIGVWPNLLFSLLWLAPLFLVMSLQTLLGRRPLFSTVGRGDWRLVISSAAAALFCGFFWEMWNAYSLARWEYAVPFVQRFRVFEMPLLGFAGYLPFGLECAAAGELMGVVGDDGESVGIGSP